MADEITDFRRLTEDAAKTAYDPHAKRCWPWWHQWTMWKLDSSGSWFQRRQCVRCGKTEQKALEF